MKCAKPAAPKLELNYTGIPGGGTKNPFAYNIEDI